MATQSIILPIMGIFHRVDRTHPLPHIIIINTGNYFQCQFHSQDDFDSAKYGISMKNSIPYVDRVKIAIFTQHFTLFWYGKMPKEYGYLYPLVALSCCKRTMNAVSKSILTFLHLNGPRSIISAKIPHSPSSGWAAEWNLPMRMTLVSRRHRGQAWYPGYK